MSINKKFYYNKFYRSVDGVYSSFWFGKFINIFASEGKKQVVDKQFEHVLAISKIQFSKLPLLVFLEGLVAVKPIFNLGIIVSRGKERQFPKLLKKSQQFNLAIQWVHKLASDRKDWYLGQRIFSEIVDMTQNKKYVLFQRRDKIFKVTIKNRSNIRYSR